MTKEELKKEAEELIQRFEMANSMNCFMQLTPDRKQMGEMLVMIAEPREKRIAFLKETNKKISDECHKLVDSFEKLQNENAELEARLNAINMLTPELEKSSKLKKQQLTKAKDLLNEFMRISKASDEDFEHDYSELIGEADQFLKETCE